MKDGVNNSHWVDIFHNAVTAWVILSVSLIITIVAWKISVDYANNRANERFEFRVIEAKHAIEKRFLNYEQVLHGGLGLFLAFDNVSRQQWRDYFETLQIDRFYPGTLGIGYSQWIKPENLDQFVNEIRAEGFADFTVKPDGVREYYTSIKYLQPFNFRNQRAFGYDMYSEPTRREAMSRARDTGETALSGKVTLVQETTTDVQAGFLIYVPVYASRVNNLDDRRKTLKGFVYSALRVGDLMNGILGKDSNELEFEIYDGDSISREALLYDSDNILHLDEPSSDAQFTTESQLLIGGHKWSLYFSSNDHFDAITSTSQPLMVAVGGVVIDLLLFNIILSLSRLRKRAQALADERMKKLLENEVRYKSITDSAYDGIVSMDANLVINYSNNAAKRLFGYETEKMLGHSFQTLVSESQQQLLNDLIQRVGEESTGAGIEPIELMACAKNGKEFSIEFSIARWTVEGHVNYTAILRDITERQRIERIKDEFVSTVSHELRTPLTAIWGSLKIIESEKVCQLNGAARGLIDTAQRNCERLTRLINDILDIEKIESGKLNNSISEFSLLDLIEQSIADNQVLATRNKLTIRLAKSADPRVNVDQHRFIQVMTNLLANAIKFSSPDGEILVDVSMSNSQVRVAVTDYGPGIPDEFRDRIFSKFAQADSTDAKKYGGTGLGLSIAKAIIESFKGEIDYESEVGSYTTFYFLLPIASNSAQAQSVTDAA